MSKIIINKKIVGWKINDSSLSISISDSHAPRRPEKLKCDIHKLNIKGEEWVVLVGLMNDRPYELIGGLSEHVVIPDAYKCGDVVKRPRKTVNSKYDLFFGEPDAKIVIKDISSVFDNPNNESLTRMISMSLRHGVPMKFLADQLMKDRHSDMFSFSRAISRVLKLYIKDGEISAKSCIECGSTDVIYSGGCPTCKDCGYSKCG